MRVATPLLALTLAMLATATSAQTLGFGKPSRGGLGSLGAGPEPAPRMAPYSHPTPDYGLSERQAPRSRGGFAPFAPIVGPKPIGTLESPGPKAFRPFTGAPGYPPGGSYSSPPTSKIKRFGEKPSEHPFAF